MTLGYFLHQAQLQGKQASLCTASFEPSSGTLGPNASMEITVNFTSHTDASIHIGREHRLLTQPKHTRRNTKMRNFRC